MSINVTGAARIAPQAAEASAPVATNATPAAAAGSYSVLEIDATTNMPKAPRFPWLSRLSSELEPAAKQKPPFPSTPQLGEHVDKAA